MPYSIMMDAGHGGQDPGAIYNGRQEKDDTLTLTLTIGEILQNNGINVEYTRTTDVYLTPIARAREANNANADLFISIHRNSFPRDNEVSGVESLIYNLTGLKLEIAEAINEQLEAEGFVNLGVKARPNLVVLKRTKMPAVLVEVGFINSDSDNELFDANYSAIAQAIAFAILDVLEDRNLIPDEDTSNNPSSPPTIPNQIYRIQVGAFRNRNYANRLLNELLELDFPAYLDDTGEFYRVGVGGYSNLNEAASIERILKQEGYQTIIIS